MQMPTAESLVCFKDSGFYCTVDHRSSLGLFLGYPVVGLCYGHPAVLGLQIIDGMDVRAGQVITLKPGLSHCGVGLPVSFPMSSAPALQHCPGEANSHLAAMSKGRGLLSHPLGRLSHTCTIRARTTALHR